MPLARWRFFRAAVGQLVAGAVCPAGGYHPDRRHRALDDHGTGRALMRSGSTVPRLRVEATVIVRRHAVGMRHSRPDDHQGSSMHESLPPSERAKS
jgi:hypothetical protein